MMHGQTKIKKKLTHQFHKQSPSSEATIPQLPKKLHAFYEAKNALAFFTAVRHLSLSRIRLFHYTTCHPNSLKCILILFPIYI